MCGRREGKGKQAKLSSRKAKHSLECVMLPSVFGLGWVRLG